MTINMTLELEMTQNVARHRIVDLIGKMDDTDNKKRFENVYLQWFMNSATRWKSIIIGRFLKQLEYLLDIEK